MSEFAQEALRLEDFQMKRPVGRPPGQPGLTGPSGQTLPTATPVPELTEAQRRRLLRQQQFLEAFGCLEGLLEELQLFSVQHHYFKESTKQGWMNTLSQALDGMRTFLPKETPPSETHSS